MSRFRHGTLLIGVGLLSAAAFRETPTNHSPFAAPTIIIFHGGPLAKAVRMASWRDNEELLLDAQPMRPDSQVFFRPFDRRISVNVALFWGQQWRSYAESPEDLASLDPARANQTGKYYPAVGRETATLVIDGKVRQLSDNGLAVLSRYGVPTRISGGSR